MSAVVSAGHSHPSAVPQVPGECDCALVLRQGSLRTLCGQFTNIVTVDADANVDVNFDVSANVGASADVEVNVDVSANVGVSADVEVNVDVGFGVSANAGDLAICITARRGHGHGAYSPL